jgi:hypothetical protein
MNTFADPPSAPSDDLVPVTDQLRLAVAAYLARFKGASRYHTESGLRCYLAWCAGHGLDPLAARRPHVELYIRWMQEIRRFKPSTTGGAVAGGEVIPVNREMSPASPRMVPAMTGPAPKTTVSVVWLARTAAGSFFLVSRS